MRIHVRVRGCGRHTSCRLARPMMKHTVYSIKCDFDFISGLEGSGSSLRACVDGHFAPAHSR